MILRNINITMENVNGIVGQLGKKAHREVTHPLSRVKPAIPLRGFIKNG